VKVWQRVPTPQVKTNNFTNKKLSDSKPPERRIEPNIFIMNSGEKESKIDFKLYKENLKSMIEVLKFK